MPYRVTPLVKDEYYHVYNRGVAFQPIFKNTRDYERFLLCLNYYQFKNISIRLSKFLQIPEEERSEILRRLMGEGNKIIELIAFCLMPNHFHLLIKQNSEDGVSRFLRLMINSYAKYFNTKYKRVGPLFQGIFKVVHVETDEQLLHLSRYIHLNPLVSFLVKEKDFVSYPWSSLQEYLKNQARISNPKPILENFSKNQDYLNFVMDQADYGKELEKIKHLMLGNP